MSDKETAPMEQVIAKAFAAATPQVTPTDDITPGEAKGLAKGLMDFVEGRTRPFSEIEKELAESDTRKDSAPTEHLIRAATPSSQSARECFLEMDAFLKHHPSPVLQARIDELLSEFPPASVTYIKPPIEGTSEQAPQVTPTLEEILKQYGAHHIRDCDALNKWTKLPCDCGFAALIEGTPEQAPPTPELGTCQDHHATITPSTPHARTPYCCEWRAGEVGRG